MRATLTRAFIYTMLVGAFAAPAAAQDAPPLPDELRPSIDANGGAEQQPLSDEEKAVLDNALSEPPALVPAVSARPLRLPGLSNPNGLDASRTDRPDGSARMVLKQPLAIDPVWDAKVGADLGLASQQSDGYRFGRPLPATRNANDTGAAWASVGVSNFASVDARVDPSNDQGKLGTTIKQLIPLGSNYAVTLQNTFSVTETLGAQPTSSSFDVPLMVAPAPGPAGVPQIWGNEKLAKFDMLSTGTTLAAGLNSTNTDPVTHNRLSAEQKIYGPLHVTTSVTDLGQPTPSKSITAGFKLNW